MLWGGLSLAGLVAVGALATYMVGPANRARDDSATASDVRFVLNWCGLGDQRIDRVVHSHVSARSLTGDHLDAYAIHLTHVELAELAPRAGDPHAVDPGRRWYRGDQLPRVFDDAVGFAGGWLGAGEIPWFPGEAQLRSSEFYVFPWRVEYHGLTPSAAELIFVRPADRMIFYLSGKT